MALKQVRRTVASWSPASTAARVLMLSSAPSFTSTLAASARTLASSSWDTTRSRAGLAMAASHLPSWEIRAWRTEG